MSDVIPVPVEALRWLQRLAALRDAGDGWDEGEPYSAFEELLAIGAVEYRPAAFRLSDAGWWLLRHAVMQGDAE